MPDTGIPDPRPRPARTGTPGAASCRQCRRFVDDAAQLEAMLPGILILSSAQGCSRGDSGICEVTGRFHAPLDACEHFEARRTSDEGALC